MRSIDLPFLQHRRWGGKDHYRYRRRLPLDLQVALGKTELSISLGKTAAEAARLVPLIGDALVAAREALAAADGPYLFTRYTEGRGANSCSASLMKWVRRRPTPAE